MLLGLAAVLCWSTVATAFKLSLQHLSPIQLMLIASAASLGVLVGSLAWLGRIKELWSQSPKVYAVSALYLSLIHI